MKWSKLKNNVEYYFADKLKGRVELRSVSEGKTHDVRGYIRVDGTEVWNIGTLRYYAKEADEMLEQVEAGQWSYYDYFKEYCSIPVETSLVSKVTLIKSLAMLDSRVDKKILKNLNMENEHEMVQYFYKLRCEVEGISLQN